MADIKWSDFPSGGPILNTDTLVGLRSGANTRISSSNILLSGNNLSDVSNSGTARDNLSVPQKFSGSGSPQGVLAGKVNDTYVDTSAPLSKFYVCVFTGTSSTAIWQLQTSGGLLPANNLSDVSSASTSLSNLGGQPINIVGSGNPNGIRAGTAGINFYFDTSTLQLWRCTVTGSSSTAVWVLPPQNGSITSIDLVSSTPINLLANTMYVGRISSPSPAAGNMPVSPSPGDVLIIHSEAAQGVTVNRATSGLVRIGSSTVTGSFFVPFPNSIVLRCTSAVTGGQWTCEAISGSIVIDGSITQNSINNIQLNKANNLSDVSSAPTSLSNLGGQPINIVGSGNPNGSQAGTSGINFYFDTSILQLWVCTVTGSSSTAVWEIQNESGLETINLVSTTPAQMLSNKLYVGELVSPGPAVGIMPISPNAGDILIIYSSAVAGTTVQIGTSPLIEISGNLVVGSFFVPQRSSIVLRCFNSASGGQWYSEAIDGKIIIDGTINVDLQPINIVGSGNPNGIRAGTAGINFYFDTSTLQLWRCTVTGSSSTAVWLSLSTESSITPSNIIYFSGAIGSDITGNGTQSFPFATYSMSASIAALLSTVTNQYGVFPIGNETVSGNIILYPFVNILGSSNSVNRLTTTSSVVLDSTWGTIATPTFSCTNVAISTGTDVNLICPSPQDGTFILFNSSPFLNTNNINFNGSGANVSEVLVMIDCLNLTGAPNFNFTNVFGVIDNSSSFNVTCINNISTKSNVLVMLNNPLLSSGNITIQSTSSQNAILFSGNSSISTLTIDGANSIALLDNISYPSSIIFSGGASFSSNLSLSTSSDGLNSGSYTPVNFTLPASPPLYSQNSTTNYIAGIDNELGALKINPILYADRNNGVSNLVVTPSNNSELLFPNAVIDTASSWNSSTSTYTVPKNGTYEIMYSVHNLATGTVTNFNWFADSSIRIDGLYVNSDYGSNENSLVANGVNVRADNMGFRIIQLTAGQIINVRILNNGDLNITIPHANISIKYIGP